MAYPKPLSEKRIKGMLALFKPEKVELLYQYYQAFANLYGAILLDYAWQILQKYDTGIREKEFFDFSEIVRREDHDYRVYEIDEVYSDDKRVMKHRLIISKKLLCDGHYTFKHVYDILDAQFNYPPFVPDDLLFYTKIRMPKEWHEMKTAIGNLKSGEKLSKLYCLNKIDKLDLAYYKSESTKAKIRARAEPPASERIAEKLFLSIMLGNLNTVQVLSRQFEIFDVVPTMNQLDKIMNLLMKSLNNAHMWHNFGWTPNALHEKAGNPVPSAISFGSGIQKAFQDGTMNKDEITEKLRKMGIDVVD